MYTRHNCLGFSKDNWIPAQGRNDNRFVMRRRHSGLEPESSISKQSGISLIELIMFIVIVSVALAGILLVMNTVTKGSADPVIHKQALAIAESLLEEIELQDFSASSGVTSAGTVNATNRATGYHIIMDYNGFSMTGITSINGASAPGLASYNASVAVSGVLLGGIAATSAVQISVAVTPPSGAPITSVGYRTAY